MNTDPNETTNNNENLSTDLDSLKKKEKCVFFPKCTKSDCPFFHPTENCPLFPRCTFGSKCRYIHPQIPCKYGAQCSRKGCSYSHPKASTVPCKFGFSCPDKVNCTFCHPPIACHFGANCTRNLCPFSHAKVCMFGTTCTVPGCTFAHVSSAPQNVEDTNNTNIEINETQNIQFLSENIEIDIQNTNDAATDALTEEPNVIIDNDNIIVKDVTPPSNQSQKENEEEPNDLIEFE